MTIITLTTDFGTADGYVGAMKGVLFSIAPRARLVDLSHQIPPQDVAQAAFLLYVTTPFFPADTVHLAVVDPGVGSQRRAIALQTPGGIFVGPDNGLFTYLLAPNPEWMAVALANTAYHLPRVSDTFHGRDLFAPVAAHLSTGLPLEALGPPVTDLVALSLPRLEVCTDRVVGEVLHADRFGNWLTSIGRWVWEGDALVLRPAFASEQVSVPPIRASEARIEWGGSSLLGIRRTFSEVEVGEPLALVNSAGFLELAVHQGSGRELLGISRGDPVTVVF